MGEIIQMPFSEEKRAAQPRDGGGCLARPDKPPPSEPSPSRAASKPPQERDLQVTELLREWRQGSRQAFDTLATLVYRELHSLARRQLRRERPHHTLQTTGLVHEALLRLMGQNRVDWNDRLHFFRIAAQMMRRILIDEARIRLARKRGGDLQKLPIEEGLLEVSLDRPRELVAVDDALTDLQRFEPGLAEIVQLRYYAGFTLPEIAQLLELSPSTVSRRWRVARAWLYRELTAGP